MNRFIICIAMITLAASAYGLFVIKYKVKELKRDLIAIHSQLAQDREQIHVLKAEWAYLSQPKRVRHLADTYLNLKYVSAKQVRHYDELKKNKTTLANQDTNRHPVVVPQLKPILTSARSYR